MNAISSLVSSSRYYKIDGVFLKAGIHDLREKHLREKYLREIHPSETSVVEITNPTTDLPATDIILHLIDNPVDRLNFNGKLSSANKVNRANIDNQCGDAENHRYTSLKNSLGDIDFSGLPLFMERGQHQPAQRLTAAIRGRA